MVDYMGRRSSVTKPGAKSSAASSSSSFSLSRKGSTTNKPVVEDMDDEDHAYLDALSSSIRIPKAQQIGDYAFETSRQRLTFNTELSLYPKKPPFAKHNDSGVFSIHISTNNRLLAAGHYNGEVSVYSVNSGSKEYFFNTNTDHSAVTALRFRPDQGDRQNVLAVCGADGSLQHWHVTSARCMSKVSVGDQSIFTCDYRRDGELLAVAGQDCAVRVYDDAHVKIHSQFKTDEYDPTVQGHTARVCSLKWHDSAPDLLLSGGWDRTIKVWDLRVGTSIREFFGPYLCGQSLDICNNEVLTGATADKDPVQIWDFLSGKLIRTLPCPAPDTQVWASQFLRHVGQKTVCFGGTKGAAYVMHYRKDVPVVMAELKCPASVYSTSAIHTGVVFGCADGTLNGLVTTGGP